MKIPKQKVAKVNGRLKQLEIREESLVVKQYKLHVDSQRQSLIIRKLRSHVQPDTFKGICAEINGMTDEQIAAT